MNRRLLASFQAKRQAKAASMVRNCELGTRGTGRAIAGGSLWGRGKEAKVFQASTRRWTGVAIGLLLLPSLTQRAEVDAQSRSRPTSPTSKRSATASPTEQARDLMKQARSALKRKDLTTARRYAMEAKRLNALRFWDESPDSLLAEIERAGGKTTPVSVGMPSDPRDLLKRGRRALDNGKLETAQDLARQAEALSRNLRWGWFEDTPAKLLGDVLDAKANRDRQESDRLLTQARQLFEKANKGPVTQRLATLDRVLLMAYRAERLHGPFSIWDLGDRPRSLIRDAEAARAELRARGSKPRAKPSNPTQLASRTRPASKKPRSSTADSKKSSKSENTKIAAAAKPKKSVVAKQPKPQPPLAQTGHTDRSVSSAKNKAMELVAEARRLQQQQELVAARNKALEALKLRAHFNPREDHPTRALQEITAVGRHQIQLLLTEAGKQMQQADGHAKAVAALKHAQEVAVGLGLDPAPIVEQMRRVQTLQAASKPSAEPAKLRTMTLPATLVQAPPAPAPTPAADIKLPEVSVEAEAPVQEPAPAVTKNHGHELLEKARLELRRGETKAARTLVLAAFQGKYGLEQEAQALLRTIESEEFAKRRDAALKALANGYAALQNRQFKQAIGIFELIEPSHLPVERQPQCEQWLAQARTALTEAEKATQRSTTTQLAASPELSKVKPAGHTVAANSPTQQPAADKAAAEYAAQMRAMQEVQFQQLRSEGLKVQSDATRAFARGETDSALRLLEDYLAKLKQSPFSPTRIALLERPIEHRLDKFKAMKRQKDFYTEEENALKERRTELTLRTLYEQNKQKEVVKLLKKYHRLLDQGKYDEANLVALRAHEIDPDDPATGAAVQISKIQSAQAKWDAIKSRKEEHMLEGINDAHDPGAFVDSNEPVSFDPETMLRNRDRRAMYGGGYTVTTRSASERQIESRLQKPITVDFKDAPLGQVLTDLKAMTGINIVPDRRALEEENILLDHPVTLAVDTISTESVLKLILDQVRLTHILQDDVLKVTTQKRARGKLLRRVIPVADLVIPIDNFALPETANLSKTLQSVVDAQRQSLAPFNPGSTPFLPSQGLQGGQAVGNPTLRTDPNQANITAEGRLNSTASSSPLSPSTFVSNPNNTVHDSLIRLITNTVAQDTWDSVGGPGTIDYYPVAMGLVINQTADVIQEVADLLEALRRLQDLEVAVEVRIITLSESFFERIGLDFSVNLKTNNTTLEPQFTTQQFAPQPYINDLNERGSVVGLTPAGTFTSDLDIPVRSSSFQYAIPPFGGFPNNPGFNGGISLGLAFLNDIQVFMFMEAAQGDRRVNVMQAPKITMFNGQTATITVSDNIFFVANVAVFGVGGQIVFVPQNTPFPVGVSVTVQTVVSADRRFVRMSLAPILTSTASTIVPLFPITTFITPVFEGGSQGQPVPFTQFIQQPSFTTVTVQTTVAVPDGGTVLLGGLKTLSEGRNEFGPPVLSKVPYIDRLFKNVGYGREAQSIMLMVTPRIIINSEEELRQTGFQKDPTP